MTRRALLLAVDGLDWRLLHQLVDAGQAPFIARLMAIGAQGRLAPDGVGLHGAVAWTTVASACWPDRHGVCHDSLPHADGVRLRAPDAGDLQGTTLWQRVGQSGGSAWCLAWPATLPPELPAQVTPGHPDLLRAPSEGLARDGRPGLAPAGPDHPASLPPLLPQRCASGFEDPTGSTQDCWPLAPRCVQPAALREQLALLRVHPDDLDLPAVAAVLPAGRHHPRGALVAGARHLLARWATLQAAALAWSAEPGWQLLALRLDGLQRWAALLRRIVPALQPLQAEGLACRFLDRLVGEHLRRLGPDTSLALVSDGSASAPGGLVLAGPGVAADTLLDAPRLVDVAPTLAARLGLLESGPGGEHPAAWQHDGRDLLAGLPAPTSAPGCALAPPATAAPDPRLLDWLQAQGVTLPELAPFREAVAQAQAAALRVWAAARERRGHADDAEAALEQALQLDPSAWALRLQLGRLQVMAGRGDACRALIDGLPAALRMPPWDTLWQGLVAFGERRWTLARERLGALPDAPEGLVLNLAAWLGWACLFDGDVQAALLAFERAVQQEEGQAWAWEGRGWALLCDRRPEAAVQAFSRALVLQPGSAGLHLWRATAQDAAGRPEAAQADRWRALALDPQLQAARAGLVHAYRRQLGLQEIAPS